MDHNRLKQLIDSEPANAGRSDAEVLAWLEEDSGEFAEHFVTERGVYWALGPSAGEAFMAGLEVTAQSNPIVARALKWLAPAEGGIDVGLQSVRSLLDQLALASAITSESAEAIKALAQPKGSRWVAYVGGDTDEVSKLYHIARARAL